MAFDARQSKPQVRTEIAGTLRKRHGTHYWTARTIDLAQRGYPEWDLSSLRQALKS
jgi:hypothetical protein